MSELANNLWPIFKAGIIAFAIGIAITFIPIIGQLIENSSGIQIFIQGVIIFRLFLGSDIKTAMIRSNIPRVYPGIIETIGFLIISFFVSIISWLLSQLVLFLIAFIATIFEKIKIIQFLHAILNMTLNEVLSIIGGMIPVFMYIKYVALSINHFI